MKIINLLSALFLFLFFQNIKTQAQPCDYPLPPANTCADAPMLCDLDGYCSNNSGATNSGTPNAFCGQVENNNWVKFIAGSDEFVLVVNVSNCNQGSGIQAQIFSTADCNFFTAVSNCIDGTSTSGTVTATGLTIGETYYLMVDGKNGDVCDYSFDVTSGEILSPAHVEIEPDGSLCENNTLSLTADAASSNTGLTYQWGTVGGNILTGTNSASIEIDAAGTYWVKVEDVSGCSDSTSIEIASNPLPQVTIAEPDTIDCLDNVTVNLQATGNPSTVAFSWSTVDGNILSGNDTASPSVDAPGTYRVVATDTVTGCTGTGEVLVHRDTETPLAVATGGGEINCLNPTLTLDGVGSSTGTAFSHQWTTDGGNILNGTNTLQVEVDAAGIYYLQVSNTNNGCVDSAEVTVTLNDAEPTGAGFSLRHPCFGEASGSIQVDSVQGGTAPFEYAFGSFPFQSSNLRGDLSNGDYLIKIKDATGCEWDTTLSIVEQPPLLLDFGDEERRIQLGDETLLRALTNVPTQKIDSLRWTPPYADCPDCLERNVRPVETTAYRLILTDVNGCSVSDEITVLVEKKRNVYIPNAFSPNGDGINDLFFINGGKDVALIKQFRIFDRWGGAVFEAENFLVNDAKYGWDGRKKGKLFQNGEFVYFAEVEFIDGVVELYRGSVLVVK